MNINPAKTPCRWLFLRPARHSNRPDSAIACMRFLAAMAGAFLLLAAGRSLGGCIDDPCKMPSLGYLFESSPSFHHRHDDASGTFCTPCYAYRPTCWRGWPEGCTGCPPPAGGMTPTLIRSPNDPWSAPGSSPPSNHGPVPSQTLPPPGAAPITPPPDNRSVSPLPDAGPTTPQAPPETLPVPKPVPDRLPAPTLPPGTTAPQTPTVPPTPIVPQTPIVPPTVPQTPIAPMPPSVPPLTMAPQRVVRRGEDLGLAPFPPSLPNFDRAGPARSARDSYAQLDQTGRSTELTRMAQYPVAPMPVR
jgi:hypothetical protein